MTRPAPAPVCLQGGAEFAEGCEAMDSGMLSSAAVDGEPAGSVRRVLVLPFAARAGHERRIASANARRWYAALGARHIDVVLDEGPDVAAALAAAQSVPTLVVLPGGSPARLLDALAPHAEILRASAGNGVAVSGASAGAMVLCRWSVLPGNRMRVAEALGVVDVDLVVPHYRGDTSWVGAARHVLPDSAVVLGLPERSGVVLTPDGQLTPAGTQRFTQLSVLDAGR